MINKLVNPINKFKSDDSLKPIKNATQNNENIKLCADSFLKNMSDLDKKRLNYMIVCGYFDGQSVAEYYDVDANSFVEIIKNNTEYKK